MIRHRIAQGRDWSSWIQASPDRKAKDLARREGVTPARLSQILRLQDLIPQIIEDLEREDRLGPVPSEVQLRRIAKGSAGDQWVHYQAVIARGDCRVTPRAAGRIPRRSGFAYKFERARMLARMWDTGEYSSLRALGRSVELTGSRVSQLMALLHLAPEIQAVLDSETSIQGVTELTVRKIARVREHEEQRRLFETKWPGLMSSV